MAIEQIPEVGAELYYDTQFLAPNEASEFFDALLSKRSWRRYKTWFGPALNREMQLTTAIPEPITRTRGRECKPLAWIPELLTFRDRVDAATSPVDENLRLPAHGYNAVLCHLYRDRNDSVGLHSDSEPKTGAGDRFG